MQCNFIQFYVTTSFLIKANQALQNLPIPENPSRRLACEIYILTPRNPESGRSAFPAYSRKGRTFSCIGWQCQNGRNKIRTKCDENIVCHSKIISPKPKTPIDFHGLQNFCCKSFGVCLRHFEFVPLLSGVFFTRGKNHPTMIDWRSNFMRCILPWGVIWNGGSSVFAH
ncbi:hypothetical protein CEXT_479561 [Caerostris extrusa]|uniref:Uncharacterized protein n=1 Tax=Caerostris extrusa TaxID=172846 RepID=A0AAV4MIP6_CAEEX|nr:hypothetical protein CEXT_479561 [Caerostris extrusa]